MINLNCWMDYSRLFPEVIEVALVNCNIVIYLFIYLKVDKHQMHKTGYIKK